MGNQGSALGDEPLSSQVRQLQHFDHSFNGELHTVKGSLGTSFGEFAGESHPVQITCSGTSMEIAEDQGLRARHTGKLFYNKLTGISWDHYNSSVKLVTSSEGEEDSFVIINLLNSVEFEQEIKLRLSGVSHTDNTFRVPQFMYVGMFAGATKPKPFQRKRPNISSLPSGKLPNLNDMRNMAFDLHRNDYRPCPPGESRRLALAVQHIYEGYNSFRILVARGSSLSNRYSSEALLLFYDEKISYRANGFEAAPQDFHYDEIEDWCINESIKGIDIDLNNGERLSFGVEYIRDVKHTFEYFWNKYSVENGKPVKEGSTHGRPLVSIHTLSGEIPAPDAPVGSSEIIDQDGIVVRPGGRIAPRRQSIFGGSNEPQIVPPENVHVKAHWHKVVKHQGWLLKKGGIGVGPVKQWIKRYFVLYGTSQGHFLSYYSDFTECPMYTSERNHRNVIDICKACFIRPGSNKAEESDTPANSFDIITIEREWTLCAENKDNMHKWLKILTRAIDEDVSILPDEEVVFMVKPKVDPVGCLPSMDYSTALKCSAFGISVTTPDRENREHFFWIYTDFYKWSLLTQNGKLALLVNVFADASFTRRNEFVFRHKEAVRLATAIEYFIEKFMSVMHIKLELIGLPDEPEEENNISNSNHVEKEISVITNSMGGGGGGGINTIDLLDMDAPETPTYAAPPPPPVPSAPIYTSTPAPAPAANPTATASQFKSDPFGDDPFDTSPPPASAPAAASSNAPALSSNQLQQFHSWYRSAIVSGTGPIYDDGILQVAIKLEIKGSQGRITFYQRNVSPAPISDLSINIIDSSGLLRQQLSPTNPSIAPSGQQEQQFLFECIKPVAPGPNLAIQYRGSSGQRSHELKLPVLVTSFNEPLSLSGADFNARWAQLAGPGQEVQEMFTPANPIDFQVLKTIVGMGLKFGIVVDKIDASDTVVNGCSSLHTGAVNQTGEKINIGSLIKVELHAQTNTVRFTVRTIYPAASTAIIQTAKSLLA